MKECANCGSKIGALEKPVAWQGNVICAACYPKLAGAPSAALVARKPGEIECPFCHKDVKPEKTAKGSMIAALFLLVCGVIPGVIYLAMNSGYKTVCPACKVKIADV